MGRDIDGSSWDFDFGPHELHPTCSSSCRLSISDKERRGEARRVAASEGDESSRDYKKKNSNALHLWGTTTRRPDDPTTTLRVRMPRCLSSS